MSRGWRKRVRRLPVLAWSTLLLAAVGCTVSSNGQTPRVPGGPTPVSTVMPTPSPPSVGRAQRGGTLDALSSSDTDTLDPNITDYSLGYELVRQYSRQLYTWPAVSGHTTEVVPDLAAAAPSISGGGTVYRISLRPQVDWNTSPPRQVTAEDVVRGVQITCNPAQPSAALPDFESVIRGMTRFCDGFHQVKAAADAIRRYLATHSIAGVHVGANQLQVVFELKQPVNDFLEMLTLPAFSPRPRELLKFVPRFSYTGRGAEDINQHTISDGPYEVASYRPDRSLTFVRNPVWNASTDPVRSAFVNRIRIDLDYPAARGRHDLYRRAYLRMRRGSPSTDVALFDFKDDYFDDFHRRHPLLSTMLARRDPNLSLSPTFATYPTIVFNSVSPNNDDALQNPQVRQALSFALDRDRLMSAMGWHRAAMPLSHVLPGGIAGSADFDLYPHDPARARAMLDAAGVHHLSLKVLYRSTAPMQKRVFLEVQRELARVGVKVQVVGTEWDFYTKPLTSPRRTREGIWDMTFGGWLPDWYGNAASRYFRPLLDGRFLPPHSSNYGLYDNPEVNRMIDAAEAGSPVSAATLWHRVDVTVMQDAPIFPIAEPEAVNYHARQAHNVVFVPAFQGPDLSNIWLARSTG